MSARWAETLRAGRARARRSGESVVVALHESLSEAPDLLALYAAAEARGDARFFAAAPSRGFQLLALGVAHEIISDHPEPFREVCERARALLTDVDPDVLLVGGFAFEPRAWSKREPAWRAFANARFTLPEVQLTQTPARTVLTRIARVQPGDAARGPAGRNVARLLDKTPPPPVRGWQLRPVPHSESERAYAEAAAAIIARIRLDEVLKVVLARCEDFDAVGTPSFAPVLQRLRATQHASLVFAQGLGGDTFLGATPERLLSRQGLRVEACAVAGTAARGPQHVRALRTSPKEMAEHAFVVRGIEAALAPRCRSLEVPRRPDLLEAGPAQHLHTIVRGELREPCHLLELAAALHPTPAVGGTPPEPALELIRRHEPFDRGWYAGPLGWFNSAGDGDLAVALRCGLFARGRLRLFAGAGLVADSDPAQEVQETTLKLRALREAMEATWTP